MTENAPTPPPTYVDTVVGDYNELTDRRDIICDCGRNLGQWYWNGGQLDLQECPCGIIWYGQHQQTVLCKRVPTTMPEGYEARAPEPQGGPSDRIPWATADGVVTAVDLDGTVHRAGGVR